MSDTGWGWLAGIGFLAIVWVFYVLAVPAPSVKGRDYSMSRLWEGADGRTSFSKFQFWLWTGVIAFSLVALWVTRVLESHAIVSPIDDMPTSVLTLLGISTATNLGAKGITTSNMSQGTMRKPSKKASDRTNRFTELFVDDAGYAELAKVQMLIFTLVAVIFFLTMVGKAMASHSAASMGLPDLDNSWMVLMGISSSGYLGKKFITRERPVIRAVTPPVLKTGEPTSVMLTGSSLGNADVGVLSFGHKMYRSGEDKKSINATWTDTVIAFDFDGAMTPGNYVACVVVGDAQSDPVAFTVAAKEG